jgi:hypothetical protein
MRLYYVISEQLAVSYRGGRDKIVTYLSSLMHISLRHKKALAWLVSTHAFAVAQNLLSD